MKCKRQDWVSLLLPPAGGNPLLCTTLYRWAGGKLGDSGFIIGILLLAVEIFIIPGFGVAGISGIILIIGGLVMGLLNNDHFDFEGVSGKEIGKATLTVLVGLVTGFSLMIWLSNKIGHRECSGKSR